MSEPFLSPSELALLERAKDFAVRVIAPDAGARDHARLPLARETVLEWAALGLNGMQVSPVRGGGGAGYFCKLAVAEAVAAVDFASAFALNNIQGMATRIEREGSPAQIARWLPGMMAGKIIGAPSLSEPGAGSDLAAITTHARKVDGGWEIFGEKAWVTNGAIADLLIMYAQTDPGSGAAGIASFLIDLHAQGITRLAPEVLMGGHAIGAAGIRLDGVRITDDELFAPPGQAFKAGLRGITGARVHVSAMVCAMVEASLRLAVRHAGQRETFGRPLLKHQGLRWQLVDVATDLEAARLLTSRAASIIDAGGDAQIEASFAKKFTAEMATRSVAACMQAMGAEGLREHHPLGRHLAGARIAAYVDGTTEIQNERIGISLSHRYG